MPLQAQTRPGSLVDSEYEEYEVGRTSPSGAATGEKFLLSLVRRNPTVCHQLGLQASVEDARIIEALQKHADVEKMLLSAGCEAKAAKVAAEDIATRKENEAAQMRMRKSLHSVQSFYSTKGLGVCIILVGILILGGAVVLHFTSTAGWKQGMCHLHMFYNESCHQGNRCAFNVYIQEKGNVRGVFQMTNWNPPAYLDTGTGHVYYTDEPFRCCNNVDGAIGVGTTCCSLFDEELDTYCDSWYHRVDSNGRACPAQLWPCIFQTGDAEYGEEATKLVVYHPPPTTALGLAGIIVSVVGVLIRIDCLPFRLACRGLMRVFLCCFFFASKLQDSYERAAGRGSSWKKRMSAFGEHMSTSFADGVATGTLDTAASTRTRFQRWAHKEKSSQEPVVEFQPSESEQEPEDLEAPAPAQKEDETRMVMSKMAAHEASDRSSSDSDESDDGPGSPGSSSSPKNMLSSVTSSAASRSGALRRFRVASANIAWAAAASGKSSKAATSPEPTSPKQQEDEDEDGEQQPPDLRAFAAKAADQIQPILAPLQPRQKRRGAGPRPTATATFHTPMKDVAHGAGTPMAATGRSGASSKSRMTTTRSVPSQQSSSRPRRSGSQQPRAQ